MAVAADLDELPAIREIERLGGIVQRDNKLPGRAVVGVDFGGREGVGDKDLSLLKSLTDLTTLNLTITHITDAGLEELRELKKLTDLDLFGTSITNAGLKEVGQLKTLVTLDIGGSQITDVGLMELRELKKLKVASRTPA
jgi:internalin A